MYPEKFETDRLAWLLPDFYQLLIFFGSHRKFFAEGWFSHGISSAGLKSNLQKITRFDNAFMSCYNFFYLLSIAILHVIF